MSIMAQLSRKWGRPLPKWACRGWGDALPQLPWLAGIKQVFQSLKEQSWWLAGVVSAPSKQLCSDNCIPPLVFLLKLH